MKDVPPTPDRHLAAHGASRTERTAAGEGAGRAMQDADLHRLAFEASPAGCVVVDGDGRIALVNHEIERMLGYDRSELVGQSIEVLVPERFRDVHPRLRRSYGRAPSVRPMGAGPMLYAVRKDGTEVPVEIGLNPVRGPHGTVVLASMVDISERREVEDRLRHAEKMEAIGVMASGIAHDFNNILMAIVGYSEMLKDAFGGDEDVRHDLDRILAASERGRLLVRRLLLFSRRDGGVRAPARPEDVLDEALPLVRSALPSSVEIRSHVDPGVPVVACDASRLHQILMNLAVNAGHAMGDSGGVLDVSVVPVHVDDDFVARNPSARPGLHARISVSDTGVGMTPEVMARVLEPFFTTRETGKGTGLGLSVVHGIVQSHRGALEIRSRPGEGTTIHVYLPADVAAAAAVAPDPDAPTQPAPSELRAAQPARILFVEDEEPLLELGRRQLEQLGYRVVPFSSSLAALEAFRAAPETFDLVVTDNTMPRMTGVRLVEEVVKTRPDMKVLMVSGLAEGLDEDVLRERGVRWVLRKPHTREALAEAVRTAVAAPN